VPDPSTELAAAVAALADSLRQLERRVSALEGARGSVPASRPVVSGAPEALADAIPDSLPDAATITKGLTLGGRTFLVLAGAFVLRALTDAGAVPAWVGVGLGLAYAGTWLVLADRASRSGPSWSALVHGLGAVAVAFPLLFEAATRFQLLQPASAAGALAAITAATLGVAAHRRLRGLAWLAGGAGVITAIALMTASGRLAAATLYLVLLGGAALWLGYVRGWVVLRWPIALVADLMVLVLALHAVDPNTVEGPRTALVVQVALMAVYLASIATRTLLLDRKVVAFEVVQSAVAILVGLGGAVFVATRTGTGGAGFGAVALAFGIGAYAVAFAFVARLRDGRANFQFYASLAIAFVLAGTGLLLPDSVLPIAWSALAVTAGALARRSGSRTLAAHSTIYALGAGVSSGLLFGAARATFGMGAAGWGAGAGSLVVLCAMAVSAWLTSGLAAPGSAVERTPQVLLLGVLAIASVGLAVASLVPLAGGSAAPASPAVVATIRTGVLVAATLAFAWLGRFPAWVEAGWLAYPTLAATVLKFLLEDVPRGRPATLVVSFALCGAALLLVPRLRGRRSSPAAKDERPAAS